MLEDAWHEYEEQLRSLGATPSTAAATLLWDTRYSLVTVVLAGFGRAAAEVGAVMIVGGNIDGVTRVMTTAIALETSKGDLPLALGLGIILVTVVLRHQRGGANHQGRGCAPLRIDGRAALDPRGRIFRGRRPHDHRRVFVRVRAGPRTVILGPNGAGKSVLMRLCHGLLTPTSGRIVWRGTPRRAQPRAQAMVFQRPVMLRRSALANVTYGLKLAGVPRAERERRARDVLDAVGLSSSSRIVRPACCPAASSKSSRSRARGRSSPKCCSSTSPRRISTPARRARSRRIVGQIHASGTKIVMTTHNLGQARRLGDEILFMSGGRLVERAPVERFFAQPSTAEAAAFIKGELPWS